MKYTLFLLSLLLVVSCSKKPSMNDFENNAINISVSKTGDISINDQKVTIAQAEELLADLSKKKGNVRYYREAGTEEPPPQAMQIISIVAKYRLPITLSSKPDFSDYIGPDGLSHPR